MRRQTRHPEFSPRHAISVGTALCLFLPHWTTHRRRAIGPRTPSCLGTDALADNCDADGRGCPYRVISIATARFIAESLGQSLGQTEPYRASRSAIRDAAAPALRAQGWLYGAKFGGPPISASAASRHFTRERSQVRNPPRPSLRNRVTARFLPFRGGSRAPTGWAYGKDLERTALCGVAVHCLVDLGRQGLPCPLTRTISGGGRGCQGESDRTGRQPAAQRSP